MRIAIVGSGISGLVAARLLDEKHEVSVFEPDDRIGGHTHTVDVEVDGERHAVDTGFIVYNEKTHPHFTRLLAGLGVESQATDMSFGVSSERGGLEWTSRGLGSVFAQPPNALRPAFLGMLREVLRFNGEARKLLEPGADEKVALGDFLLGAGYSRSFIDHYVLPIGAAIRSADPSTLLRIPAASFVRLFESHGLLETPPSLSWRVVRGGSDGYVEKLTRPFRDRIHTHTPVRGLRRRRRRVELVTEDGIQRFDHAILALHSDQAMRLLLDISGLERTILGAIRYQRNEVVLHRDTALMPRSPRARASWNYRIPEATGTPALVTCDLNRLQGLDSAHRFLVTLNGSDRIEPTKVLGRYVSHRPIFDAAALEAQKRHALISGANRTHFCGAYWGSGFHDDGVESALTVCRHFGVDLA